MNQFSDQYIAPSWSWAALRGPMQMIYDTDSRPVQNSLSIVVHEAEVVAKSANPLGAISKAFLTVDACCDDVWYQGSHGEPPFNDSYLALVLNVYNAKGIMIGTGFLDFLGDSMNGTLQHALAVVISQRIGAKEDAKPVTYFLLVERVGDGEEDRYRRIGIGQTNDLYYGLVMEQDTFVDKERRRLTLL